MQIEVGFGKGTQKVEIPDQNIISILTPNDVPVDLMGPDEVKRALAAPIGSAPLRELVQPGKKIAVITSDITRPVPTWDIMPALLDELYAGGAKAEDITLYFALGSHRKHSEEEKRQLAGDRAFGEICCKDADNSECVHYGVTKRGTPVDIVKEVAEADMRICLGNVEYHYFAGYSGGYKAIMPGVSTFEAIQKNHSLMVDEEAYAGHLEGNPVREDIEEAGAMVGVDFIVNVVLDEHKKIVHAAAGDVVQAHREACGYLDQMYKISIPKRADIVIVSQGGAPKDLNLYQTQKALDNSKHAVRDGGVVILVGSCKEGLGQPTFEAWMKEAEKPQDIIDHLKRDFRLGGHKAAAIAQVMGHADIYLVSEMEPDFVRSIFFTPFATLEEAYAAAVKKLGTDAGVYVMPYGGSTLPKA